MNCTGTQWAVVVVGRRLAAAAAGTSAGGRGVLVPEDESAIWVAALISLRLTALIREFGW